MEITEVRVKLVDQDKLKAFCSITIDNSFVIRDLKIIEGAKGLFVAMPSRKLTVRCRRCGSKNQVQSNYCAECGTSMPPDRRGRSKDGRLKLHADIAHPINSSCREQIQSRVLNDFELECQAAAEPGYEPQSFDDYDDEFDTEELYAGGGRESEGEGSSGPRVPADSPYAILNAHSTGPEPETTDPESTPSRSLNRKEAREADLPSELGASEDREDTSHGAPRSQPATSQPAPRSSRLFDSEVPEDNFGDAFGAGLFS